ncbi:hypothetical protein ARMSODRAFT_978632 [Armillaria solidipes]|uniref:Uncharacterized protein n=1 Tax=Armillaria solidipes TaxID=1076256 RepID=A0A2H3BPE0_9AGAR|nr:hypothetical protein ARMSODRAFT_978632 [Armillaria solidipes]
MWNAMVTAMEIADKTAALDLTVGEYVERAGGNATHGISRTWFDSRCRYNEAVSDKGAPAVISVAVDAHFARIQRGRSEPHQPSFFQPPRRLPARVTKQKPSWNKIDASREWDTMFVEIDVDRSKRDLSAYTVALAGQSTILVGQTETQPPAFDSKHLAAIRSLSVVVNGYFDVCLSSYASVLVSMTDVNHVRYFSDMVPFTIRDLHIFKCHSDMRFLLGPLTVEVLEVRTSMIQIWTGIVCLST